MRAVASVNSSPTSAALTFTDSSLPIGASPPSASSKRAAGGYGPAFGSQVRAWRIAGHSIGRAVASVRPVEALEAPQTGSQGDGECHRGEDRSANRENPG